MNTKFWIAAVIITLVIGLAAGFEVAGGSHTQNTTSSYSQASSTGTVVKVSTFVTTITGREHAVTLTEIMLEQYFYDYISSGRCSSLVQHGSISLSFITPPTSNFTSYVNATITTMTSTVQSSTFVSGYCSK